ncbi:MAG: DEAD/DEAH box helicase [Clostridia bacterium]|jgi:superfamily II DNA/RNA helicase|nr:DEAD/DEAH box helicase [Clostridia bacterium]MCI2000749.1 DEAD/DEAH box helicase [Clostridia bacterium]MCI2015459.1 DEAD/DEAH box helicase [Clostridia bacterium]
MNFTDIGISKEIENGLLKEGITNPTEIQSSVIPQMLEGKDIIAQSQTGSGKTLAYLCPLFMKVDCNLKSTQAIVLTPTHELAAQVYHEAKKLAEKSNIGVKSILIIGGANITRQIDKLKEKPQIVIGSSGRILELIKKRKIKAYTVKTIVIDEADRMLDDANIQSVEDVVKTTLKERQMVILSASMTKKAIQRAQMFMKEPENVIGDTNIMPETIEHCFITCEKRESLVLIRKIMAGLKPQKMIVFVNNPMDIEVLAEKLRYHGLKAGGIYGKAHKFERKTVMDAFREGRINILVASDIGARGLDFDNVEIVINIDIPEDPVFYQHRAGRTGRGGKHGLVISFVTRNEKKWISQYANKLGISFAEKEMIYGKLTDVVKKHDKI